MKNQNSHKASLLLIFLCWLVYSISYLGKVNYSANINQVIEYYGVSHSEAGLVGTLLFFAYGACQIINGLLCKRYNLRLIIFIGLFGSGVINLIIGFTSNFTLLTILWFVNGVMLAFLWPSLIRLLTETLTKEYMAKASVIMGTTVAVGTFIIYALSALYVNINFKLSFITAGVAMPIVALIWLFTLPKTLAKIDKTNENAEIQKSVQSNRVEKKIIYLTIFTFFIMAVAINLIKDGLITWVPSILKETYGLDDSISIILTLILPVFAIFGNLLGVKLHKKIPDFVLQVSLMFLISGGLIGVVIAGLSLNQFALTVICFAFVCLLISSCNSIVTGIFPLFMKGKVNSGLIAGAINGCCYLGSTLSSYGLGVVADVSGWNAVFWLLLGVCALMILVYVVYFIIKKSIKN
jgi:OPA family glycerol-3-phosphate transporter-like MFS transporter